VGLRQKVVGFEQLAGKSQIKSNQIKFIEQQRAKSHLQVAKTMTETINFVKI